MLTLTLLTLVLKTLALALAPVVVDPSSSAPQRISMPKQVWCGCRNRSRSSWWRG